MWSEAFLWLLLPSHPFFDCWWLEMAAVASPGAQHLPAVLFGLWGHDATSSVSLLIASRASNSSASMHLPWFDNANSKAGPESSHYTFPKKFTHGRIPVLIHTAKIIPVYSYLFLMSCYSITLEKLTWAEQETTTYTQTAKLPISSLKQLKVTESPQCTEAVN